MHCENKKQTYFWLILWGLKLSKDKVPLTSCIQDPLLLLKFRYIVSET